MPYSVPQLNCANGWRRQIRDRQFAVLALSGAPRLLETAMKETDDLWQWRDICLNVRCFFGG